MHVCVRACVRACMCAYVHTVCVCISVCYHFFGNIIHLYVTTMIGMSCAWYVPYFISVIFRNMTSYAGIYCKIGSVISYQL